tara:strand:- start:26063 stop:26680 length:618 start_codon:yes stop_codon:yes gene_type:complete
MKLYVEASSKKSLIQRLASGEEISGYNYSMFGGGGRYMLDDNLADGTIIAIYSQMSQGNPVAKSWGTWTNKVLKSETFEAMTVDENQCSVCGSEAVHHYKNGAVQLCDKHFQQQFGRYSAESFEATNGWKVTCSKCGVQGHNKSTCGKTPKTYVRKTIKKDDAMLMTMLDQWHTGIRGAQRNGYIMGITGIIVGWFINNQFFCRK